MSTFKKAKVVILPTNQKANIYAARTGGLGFYNEPKTYTVNNQGRHIYIISDDEIKEGDWFIHHSHGTTTLLKAIDVKDRIFDNQGTSCCKSYCKKIIATTDTYLYKLPEKPNFNSYMSFSLGNPLPRPSKQFIQKFIEEYNEGNVITDVLVEYENIYTDAFGDTIIQHEKDTDSYLKQCKFISSNLKINPKDNTITIKKVKDNWNKEEVDRLLDEQASKTTDEMLEKFKDYKSKDEVIDLIVRAVSESHDWSNENNNIHSIGLIEKRFLNKWIEENI